MNHDSSHPALVKMTIYLEELEEILQNHSQAKIISLQEHIKIRLERDRIKSLIVETRKKIVTG